MSVALVARPNFDVATEYGSYYLGIAANYAQKRFQVIDLYAADAVKINIFDAIVGSDPIYCYFLGHGNADVYTAQDQEVVFQTCIDNEVMAGKILLLLSCSCGIRLGPNTVSKGALAVFAFEVDFTWVATGDPATDEYARGFFEAINTINNNIVDGYTTGEAYVNSINVWNQWIDFWSASSDPYASLVVQHMVHDRDGMKLFGDETVRATYAGPVIDGIGITPLPFITGSAIILLSLLI